MVISTDKRGGRLWRVGSLFADWFIREDTMAGYHQVERRKHSRQTPQYETIVFNGEVFGQLLDISKNGMSFAYTSEQVKFRDMILELDIMCSHPKLYIPKLLCKSVIDICLQEGSDSVPGAVHRRSVEFRSISAEQRDLIDRFLLDSSN